MGRGARLQTSVWGVRARARVEVRVRVRVEEGRPRTGRRWGRATGVEEEVVGEVVVEGHRSFTFTRR